MLKRLLAVTLLTFAAVTTAAAAELVMFERAGCSWCEAFDREVAPVYPKTAEGARAPLRRLNIYAPLPSDLAFIKAERLTPLFVLVDDGREIGRIRGYPGDDLFWSQMTALMQRLDEAQLAKR
jgi:thioredoxin-related protein